MEEAAPLLQSNLTIQDTTTILDKNLPSLDEVIEQCLGGFAWPQLLQSILVSLSRLLDGQQTFITVYTDSEPSWHDCTNLTICNNSTSNLCKPASSKTIISEFGLECANPFIKGLPASSYFMGCVLGLLALGSLADSSLGRKKLLLFSCLLMCVASLTTILSTNIWMYAALKFVSGIGRASIGTCSLVLLTEKVGKKWRGLVSVVGFLFFTMGYLSLPGIAYALKGSSWRSLYLWCSVPGVFYCVVIHFFVSESPRWLFMQGREEEAVAVLRKIGSVKNIASIQYSNNSKDYCASKQLNFYSSFKILFERKWALRRVLLVMTLGFGIGMVYYGMPLGIGNLGFNIYLGVLFNALLEIPSYVITLLLLEKCNRKASLLGFTLASGVFGVICALVGNKLEKIKIWLEIASLFNAVTAFNVLLAYSVEFFPTCVRNCAMSMVSEALNLGAVFSPMLDSAGRGNDLFSFGVFGLVIALCGLFVNCLPETKGAILCDTMDEQEQQESKQSKMGLNCSIPTSTNTCANN